MTEETIFTAALEKGTAAERSAFLDQACGGDAALRQRVEALIAAHERAADFLEKPAVEQIAAGVSPPTARTEAIDAIMPATEGITETPVEPPLDGKDGQHLDFLAPSAKPNVLGRLDHYEVLAVIGRGGMGVVLKAFDEVLQRVVAIKVMAPQLAATAIARKRFHREAQAAAAVRDEHVIDIHHVDEVNGLPYLVMEYVNGLSLQERLDQSGPLELREILRIGMQTAAGLAKAHAQGLIHRDIKPANILLENGVQRVKLTDFGLARAVDDASLTQSGVIAGTPQYMAPEQARGETVDHRADLFSLGSVLYAMCTGRPPFRASSVMATLKRVCEDAPRPAREINPDIPDWLAAIIDKLHAKEPAQRFPSAVEVAELLGQHLAHLQQPSLVPMPPQVERPYAGAATTARKRALLWPVLLMLTPLLLIPVVMAGSLLSSGFLSRLLLVLSMVVSGAATLTALIWFVWLTARREQKKAVPLPPSVVERPSRPRSRKKSGALPWALAAFGVVGLGCCVLGVPMFLMFGWVVGRAELRPESMESAEPAGPDEAGHALAAPRAAARARRFAPPKDVPITQDGVTATADGWKIENTSFQKRTVRLFEVRDLDIKDCRLLFRVQMKTETKEKLENRQIFTRLETAFRPEVTIKKGATGNTVTAKSWSDLARRGNTAWAQEEVTTNCLSQPEAIALNLLVEGIGTIWIKDVELVALPLPAKAGGERPGKSFVILPRAGEAERTFATLAEAVAAANGGDTIEVRGDGPYASEPIRVAGKALTIRAGGGFQPIINLQPKGGKIEDPLVETDSPLVLEGLALQRLQPWQGRQGHPERNALLLVWKAPVRAANCRFVMKTSGVGIWAIESSVCDLRNCEFGGPDLHAAVDWTSPPRGTLSVENCLLLAGPHGLVIHQKWADAEGSSIRLTHNTLSANVLLEYWLWAPIQGVLAQVKDPTRRSLRIEAKANLFDTPGHVLDFKQIDQPKPLAAKEAETALPRLVSWREQQNIYPAKPRQLLLLSSAGCGEVLRIPVSPNDVATTAEWGRYWGEEKTDAVPGMLRYQGGDVRTRAKSSPERIRPTDFRLRNDSAGKGAGAGGRDLGADVDLVGPGPAYERWKKTPAYQQWLKAQAQGSEGKP